MEDRLRVAFAMANHSRNQRQVPENHEEFALIAGIDDPVEHHQVFACRARSGDDFTPNVVRLTDTDACPNRFGLEWPDDGRWSLQDRVKIVTDVARLGWMEMLAGRVDQFDDWGSGRFHCSAPSLMSAVIAAFCTSSLVPIDRKIGFTIRLKIGYVSSQ